MEKRFEKIKKVKIPIEESIIKLFNRTLTQEEKEMLRKGIEEGLED